MYAEITGCSVLVSSVVGYCRSRWEQKARLSGRAARALVGMQPTLQTWHTGVSSGWRTHFSDMGGCIDRFQTSHRVSLRSRTAQNLS
jgi:hypothetical protein